jgi:hypothetical protein
MQNILEKAIEEYRRRRILEQANAEYAALRQAPDAASTWQEEVAIWDGTLGDGLGPEDFTGPLGGNHLGGYGDELGGLGRRRSREPHRKEGVGPR